MGRRYLGFTIEEWRALPWWQRRVYVEGLNNEAKERAGGEAEPNDGGSWADAVLGDGDVSGLGFST